MLIVVDGPELPEVSRYEEAFIYLDRPRCVEPFLESVWLLKATTVGYRTFHSCERLVCISMPAIESIADGAFMLCFFSA